MGTLVKLPELPCECFFIFKFIFINILKLFLHIIGLICCLIIIVLICLFSLVFSNRCIQNYVHLSSRYMIPTLFNRDVLGLCWLHHSQLKFFLIITNFFFLADFPIKFLITAWCLLNSTFCVYIKKTKTSSSLLFR